MSPDNLLEEDILETRYQAQRPHPVKVMVWGAIAYGACFGVSGGMSTLMMFALSGLPWALLLLTTSLHALGSGIAAFVIGKVSQFRNSLLLGIAGAIGGIVGWMGIAFIRMAYLLDPPSVFFVKSSFRFDPPLLLFAAIGTITGLGLGIVQKTRRQLMRSISAGILGFGLYALALPFFNHVRWRLFIDDRFVFEGIKFALIYAFTEFVFGCVLGSIIGALFGWVVAHNPVQNLRVLEDRTS